MNRFLLILLTSFAVPTLASVCEDEMKPVTALIRILKNGLKLGDLTPEQVEENLLKGEIKNPFAAQTKSVKTISFRTSFAKHQHRILPNQVKVLRARVRTLLKVHKSQLEQVDTAREDTKYIISIKETGKVPSRQSAHQFSEGTFQGRTVFIGKLFDGVQITLQMIDPLNPDKGKRAVQLGQKLENEETEVGSGFFFQWQGEDYFIRESGATTFNLQEARETPFPFKPSPTSIVLSPYGLRNSPDLTRVVSAWYNPNSPDFYSNLWSWDLSGKTAVLEAPSEPIPKTVTRFRMSTTNGRAIVGLVPTFDLKTMLFYDFANGPKKFAQISLDEPAWSFIAAVSPMVFTMRGRWYALAHCKDSSGVVRFIGQFDLQNGKFVQEIDLPGIDTRNIHEVANQEIDGEPFAIFKTMNEVAFFNLKTWKLLPLPEGLNFTTYAFFKWQGQSYLIHSTGEGELQIRSMADGDLKWATKVLSGSAYEIFTYEDGGLPKAFVTMGLGESPIFVNLVNKEEK